MSDGITDAYREQEREKERLSRLKEERLMYCVCKHCGQVIRRYTLTGLWRHLHNDHHLCSTLEAEPKEKK